MLEKTEDKTRESKDVLDNTILQIENTLPRLTNPATTIAESVAWNMAMDEVSEMRESLEETRRGIDNYVVRKGFDMAVEAMFGGEGILSDMAGKANETIVVATLLFLGYIDQATALAESHGGVGGTDTNDLKRLKDEDDHTFMARCINTARRIMRPRGMGRRR